MLLQIQEVDEGFIVTATQNKVRGNLKRGRGIKRLIPLAVAAESKPLEDLTRETSRQCRYFRIEQLDGLMSNEIEGLFKKKLIRVQ